MPKKLYLHLKNGRTIHVTSAWNGAAPTEEGMVDGSGAVVGSDGKEVAAPFRNIFRTQVKAVAGLNSPYTQEAVLPGVGTVTNQASGTPIVGQVAVALSTPSDDAGGIKPRQYFAVYTWLVFEDTEGVPYKFRKASVEGWGSEPPLD